MTKTTEGKTPEHDDKSLCPVCNCYDLKYHEPHCAPPATERPEAKGPTISPELAANAKLAARVFVDAPPDTCDFSPDYGLSAPPERPRMTEERPNDEEFRIRATVTATDAGHWAQTTETRAFLYVEAVRARAAEVALQSELSAAREREAQLQRELMRAGVGVPVGPVCKHGTAQYYDRPSGRAKTTCGQCVDEENAQLREREARLEQELFEARNRQAAAHHGAMVAHERAERAEAEAAALKKENAILHGARQSWEAPLTALRNERDDLRIRLNALESDRLVIEDLRAKAVAARVEATEYRAKWVEAEETVAALKKEREELAEEFREYRARYTGLTAAIERAESAEKDAAELRGRVERMTEALGRIAAGNFNSPDEAEDMASAALAPSGTGEKK